MIDPEARVDCTHAEPCGGCPAIGLRYGAQLARKRARVETALARHVGLGAVDVGDVAGADPIAGYRVRAKLVVGARGELGLYARGGRHEVLDIPECRVLAPGLAALVSRLRAWLGSAPPELRRGLRGLDVREVEDQGAAGALVTLILDAREERDEARQAELAAAVCASAGRSVTVAASFQSGPQLLGRGLRVLAGSRRLRDRGAPSAPWIYAVPGAFVQAHRGQAARLHERVCGALGELRGKSVLELFAGSGALGLGLAASGARVTLVDAWSQALESACQAAREQSIEGVDALAGDAAEIAAKLAASGRRFDAVIANPPRRGLAPALRRALAELAPALVVYVSCNPESFARDLAALRGLGLASASVEPLDLIPLSDEIECVALLRPAPPPPPRVLYSDGEVWIVAKDPHEPTTPQGGEADSLLRRVQRLAGSDALAPVHRLDIGTSGACLFARRAEVGAWSRALAAGCKQYLAGVRGITRARGSIARPLADGPRRQPAHTRYRRIEVSGGHSLLWVEPLEGRTHQIRRHLASLGHPVLGDARHGHAPTNRHMSERHGLDRTFLHCGRIELVDPRSGESLVVEAPLPGDLAAVLASLGEAAATQE